MHTCAASAASRPSGIATIAVRGVINSLTGRSAKARTPETTAISSAEASASVSALESTAASAVRFDGSRHATKGASRVPSCCSRGTACATIGSAQRRPTTRGTRYAAVTRSGTPSATVTMPSTVGVVRASSAGIAAAAQMVPMVVSAFAVASTRPGFSTAPAAPAAGAVENPGRVLATANALTTIGTICAAAAIPALLARTTPTVLGIVTVALGVPLLAPPAYLVPRLVGRRWAEPIVAHAVPRLQQLGTLLAPFVAWRDPSKRTALAAVLSNADTEALAPADEMAVVSGVLAFADRPVKELMTPRTAIVAIPE